MFDILVVSKENIITRNQCYFYKVFLCHDTEISLHFDILKISNQLLYTLYFSYRSIEYSHDSKYLSSDDIFQPPIFNHIHVFNVLL